jgi:hypothetical protein
MPPVESSDRLPVVGGIRRYTAAAVLAVAFLVAHIPYLPASLEDLDSINFALAVRDFDVANHQPHPPGYPIYVGLAKITHALIPIESRALAVIGIIAGALGVFVLMAFFSLVEREPTADARSIIATLLTITAPLYWFTAARPLSDMVGFAAALGAQAATVAATTQTGLVLAAFGSALAIGIRSQAAWLTIPLLALMILRQPVAGRARIAIAAATAFVVGCAVWAIPLIVLNGGPASYWRALFSQGAEDLSGVQMLWTTPTPRQFVRTMFYTFLGPWAVWPVAAVVLLAAAAGTALMLLHGRRPLAVLGVAFGPYLIFHFLFQETVTTRYALPLVPLAAYLAARGLEVVGSGPAIVIAVCVAAFNAHAGGTSVAAYSRQKAPAFRMLEDMGRAANQTSGLPTLAMDRRAAFDLRRAIAWVGDDMPPLASRLPSPPQHEWLELVKHWNGPGQPQTGATWFIADPLRTDIDLVQHPDPTEYAWALPYPVLIGGVRPNAMHWYRMMHPDWYVGEGWALTPEAAGVSTAAGRIPVSGPIDAWVKKDFRALVIGGRNLRQGDPPARVTVDLDEGGVQLDTFMAPPGAFLRVLTFDEPGPVQTGETRYAKVSVTATTGSHVAIEQFDASRGRPVFGFGDGWHEQEYNPATGLRWRWLSGRGEIRLHAPRGTSVVLHVEGESPLEYFTRPSRLIIRAGDRIVREEMLQSDFSFDTVIPSELLSGPVSTLTLETDQTYVPAERSRRTQDRRHLGLRIFKCRLRPVDPPAS